MRTQGDGSYAGLEELATRIVNVGAFTPGDKFDALLDEGRIDECFTAGDAGFARIFIVFDVAVSEERNGRGEEEGFHDIGGIDIVMVERGIAGDDGSHGAMVGGDGRAGGGSEGDEPLEVACPNAHGACPDDGLIAENMFRGVADGQAGGIVALG
jgi:hypothetical protein